MTVFEFFQLEQKNLQKFLEHVSNNPEDYPDPNTMEFYDWIAQYSEFEDNLED